MRIAIFIAALLLPAIANAADLTVHDTGIKCDSATTFEQKTICENEEYVGVFKFGGGRYIIAVPYNLREGTDEQKEVNRLAFYLQDRSAKKTNSLRLCMDESVDMPFANDLKPIGRYISCAESLDFMSAQLVHFDEKTSTLRIAGEGNCNGYGVAYYKLNMKAKQFDLAAYITQPDCATPGYAADAAEIVNYEKSIGAKFPKLPQ